MKRLMISASSLLMFLTVGAPVSAQQAPDAGTSTVKIEDEGPQRLSDLGMAIFPQIGVSSFEYSKGVDADADSKLTGGVTVEFGKDVRKLETGLMVLETAAATYLTIPMNAKLRLVQMSARQSWYGKFGFMPAFEMGNDRDVNNTDVIGSLGIGGRMEFNKSSDFIIEGTFNRGLMDAVRNVQGDNLNQGFLVMAGMSFQI